MKRTRNKKRRPTILVYAIALLFVSLTAYTFTAIYLKQYNNDLSVTIQQNQSKIETLSKEKEALQVEIDKLATKTKVVDVVESEDMNVNKDNIVYINGSDE